MCLLLWSRDFLFYEISSNTSLKYNFDRDFGPKTGGRKFVHRINDLVLL